MLKDEHTLLKTLSQWDTLQYTLEGDCVFNETTVSYGKMTLSVTLNGNGAAANVINAVFTLVKFLTHNKPKWKTEHCLLKNAVGTQANNISDF